MLADADLVTTVIGNTGTTIASYCAAAAGLGAAVLAARFGIMMLIGAFKSVGGEGYQGEPEDLPEDHPDFYC